ncbi:hypothetical protein GCM10023168_11600 [Fodinibacter luteus]|uniref:Fructose-bisphosphate aldolase n=1 Tax=Fodinibacter luteus TaxID=552064 RepID=A0ABP8K7B1_9MICO
MSDAAHTPAVQRALDRKLERIHAGQYTPDDFVVADAKDADMAFGVMAGGPVARDPQPRSLPGVHRTRAAYLAAMRAEVEAGAVDILLTSASNGEVLAGEGALGDDVTLAVRANDTTDIWSARGSVYAARMSRPFRTAHLASVRRFCDLVLYSVTLNNDVDHDLATLEAYREFRLEAADLGMRHFLEVFNPNAPQGLAPDDVPAFVNDSIIRLLAGVTAAHRPVFLKMAYNGRDAVAELVEHDPSVVVGILGGSAGTTRDALELLHRAEAAGARVSLFGRKIQRAESQLDLLAAMRRVLRGELSPEQGVRTYHEALAAAGIESHRPLDTDLQVTERVLRDE